MSRFVLNTPWLRKAFPPSELPREGPSILSDDVQLTADYFGGGFAFREPQQWFSEIAIQKVADNTIVDIDTMPVDQIVRIWRVGVRNDTGAQVVALQGALLVESPNGVIRVPMNSPGANLIPAGVPAGFPANVFAQPPVVIPGLSKLRWYFFVGDNTFYTFSFLFCAAPRGVAIIA